MSSMTVTRLGNGVYRVTDGTRSRIAYAAGPADARWVFIDGRVYVIDAAPRGLPRRKKRSDDHGALAAPISG